MKFRAAQLTDIPELLSIEEQVFPGDRLSARQMKRFIHSTHNAFLLAVQEQNITGYALVLFHRGTLLCRLYSLAVAPQYQGQGIASQLLKQCEAIAVSKGYITLRLEVREDNFSARMLYEKMGFKTLKTLVHYYDDLADGLRLQKRLIPTQAHISIPMPLYVQTTPFTCGAACLQMSFATLDPQYQPSRQQEIQLWREATTVFMASGHGGCSGQGLALAAHRRGYAVELWSHSSGTPFIDSVRQAEKKAIIELVHEDFCQQLEQANIPVFAKSPNTQQLETWLSQHACVVILISTYRFNGNKEPHWIVLSGMSDDFFFFHDPSVDNPNQLVSSASVPINKAALNQILGFGKQKHTCCLVITKG